RLDYTGAASRSIVTSPAGVFQIVQRKRSVLPPHVGLFAEWDMLSGFGIRHLVQPGVQRTTLQPGVVNGRPSIHVKAVTGRTKTIYRRTLTDEVDVQVDQATNLVAEISRRQPAERSLDAPFQAAFRFSDYRTANGLTLPFRIERVIQGVVREVITVQTIELNPVFARDLFTR